MDLLTTMIMFALIATLAALGTGVVSMVRGGEFDRKHGNQLMFARVGFQGLAILLLLVALIVATT